jgi:uncharacterized phage protein gp47/JayE
MGTLNNAGYEVRTRATVKALVQAAFRASWPGLDLSEQGPEGVWINWLSEWLYNNDIDGLNIFNAWNLNNSTGVMLSFMAILRGTRRNDGTKAVIDVTLTSSSVPYTIAANTKFRLLDTDYVFENLTAITVSSVSQSAQFQCTVNGETGADVGNQLSSVQIVSELTDITITAITDGTDQESDETLRERLRNINSISSSGDVDAIYSALKNLSNVQKVRVYENDSASEDENGVPAYSINAVVLGGTNQEIVDNIRVKKNAGTPTFGAASALSTDAQGYSRTIYFDRPSQTRVYIAASVTPKPGQLTTDYSYNDTIRANCKQFINSLDIGKDVSYTTVYGLFAFPAIGPSSIPYSPFDIAGLQMSTSPSADFAATNLSIGIREYAWLDDYENDITITTI